MYQIQRKVHKYLDNHGNAIYVLNHGNLNLNHCLQKKLVSFDNGYTGIFVSDYAKAPEELIRIYAHEYKHVDDLSHILRLKYVADGWKKLSHEDFQYLKANEPEYYNFVTGSIKKGLIEKGGENSNDYHYYKSLEKYLDCEKYEKQVKTMQDQLFHPVEVGPIREAQKELKKFELLQKNIRKILHSD